MSRPKPVEVKTDDFKYTAHCLSKGRLDGEEDAARITASAVWNSSSRHKTKLENLIRNVVSDAYTVPRTRVIYITYKKKFYTRIHARRGTRRRRYLWEMTADAINNYRVRVVRTAVHHSGPRRWFIRGYTHTHTHVRKGLTNRHKTKITNNR